MASVRDLESRYYRSRVDDHAIFDQMIRCRLFSCAQVLDAGAGRGLRNRYDYRTIAGRVVGIDLDPGVRTNPNVDVAVVGNLAALPFDDATFDLALSNYVFEHLRRPLVVLTELRRVLRDGAHLIFHTPNRYHYVAMAALLTPQRFHEWFNERRGCENADTFPTVYRANDRKTIEHLAARSGFDESRLVLVEPKPDYLTFHPLAYRAGICYERVVNRSERLRDLRCVIVGDLVARLAFP